MRNQGLDLAHGAGGQLLQPLQLAGGPTGFSFQQQARDGLQVALDVDGEQALPETVAAGLYSIAQEALANVVKHSGTLEATVRLKLGGDRAYLEIEDHGLGFDPQAALGQLGHLGLAGMAEQAREIGWNLAVDSRPGLGTRIRVEEKRAEGEDD